MIAHSRAQKIARIGATVFFSFSILLIPGFGEATDKAQDLLIEKLTRVHLSLPAEDSSKIPITLRLADLHAERGRQLSVEEMGTGCSPCLAGNSDRRKAIELYEEALPKLDATKRGSVLIQLGHLFQLLGEGDRAISVYTQVLNEVKEGDAFVEAHLALGEIRFRGREYPVAMKHYEAVLSQAVPGRKGLAAYRRAWSLFHLGQVKEAVDVTRTILKSPELLTRSEKGGVVSVDVQFQQEVSRDYATFLAQLPATMNEAKELFQLSPADVKLSNMAFLAKELERLGHQQTATAVWYFVIDKESSPLNRLEGYVLLAQMHMNLKQQPEAIKAYKKALALWSSVDQCKSGDVCKELKTRIKNFVIDWNRVEKEKPSRELFAAYQDYLKVFPEKDMALWAAQVARSSESYEDALAQYQLSARLILTEQGADAKKQNEELEAVLLSQIEVAELAKNKVWLQAAYDRYLEQSRIKKESFRVRYQKAHLLYEAGDNENAATTLKQIALDPLGDKAIRLQAADLALDALVLIKDDARLEAWAAEFLTIFPERKNEYGKIARTSVLNQAVATTAKKTSEGDVEAWNILSRFDVEGAGEQDRISYYKNRLILAEKLRKIQEARAAADALLAFSNLSKEDRQFALGRKAWFAELVLDFQTALKMSEQLELAELSEADRQLRLALFASLSGGDPNPYYEKFLKVAPEDERAATISARIVRSSSNPAETLKKQLVHLHKKPAVYGELALEIFAKAPSVALANSLLKDNALAQTAGGKILKRYILLEDISELQAKIVAHQLDQGSQNRLANSLKARIGLLTKVEAAAQKSIESADWSAQLVSLTLLANESERFYQEILSLPMPDGLDEQQQMEYMTLLSQQASPHQLKAQDVRTKLAEFWANEQALTALKESVNVSDQDLRNLAVYEVEKVAAVASEEVHASLKQVLAQPVTAGGGEPLPQLAQLEGARQQVRDNPFDVASLRSLIQVEKRMGHVDMVAYLEARLQRLGQTQGSGAAESQGGVQ